MPRLVAALALATLAPLPATAGEQAELFAETFVRAWTIVAETHFDADLNGVDWQAVRDELEPRARAASDADALREVLDEMVGRLGQSHFEFITSGSWSDDLPGDEPDLPAGCTPAAHRTLVDRLEAPAAGDATGGLELRILGDDVVVERIVPESAAAERRLRPGWALLRVDGLDVASVLPCFDQFREPTLRQQIEDGWLASLLRGAPGSLTDLVLETGSGRTKAVALERRPPPGDIVAFGNLPATRTHFTVDWTESPAGGRVAILRFNIWLLPIAAAVERAMPELRQADGLVFDLRGNPGGIAAIAQGVASHFVSERASLGTLKSRRNALELVVQPRIVDRSGARVEPFSGPIAILIDGGSASTSEVFAAGMHDIGRAVLFGEPSAGAALPAIMDRLPNGDLFLHATMDYIRPDGTRVEGARIQPDVLVIPTRRDFLEDRDPILVAALSWLDRHDEPSP